MASSGDALMKIAFILPGGGRSGGVRCTVAAANLLAKRGHNVRLMYKKGKFRERIVSGINAVFFAGESDWLRHFTGEALAFNDVADIEFEKEEMIIGVGMWSSAQLGRLTKYDNPKVQYLHGLTPWMPSVEKEALSQPYPKIAVASYILEAVHSCNPASSCLLVPNGIDFNEYCPALSENDRDGAGTIYSRGWAKDPETILDVLQKLGSQIPEVPHYIFGQEKRPREISAVSYKRYPSVRQACEIYSRCRVWLLCSRSEGFGMPILEAMACGCAVVSTDCGGPKDIIKDGENGFLVDVGNSNKLFEKAKLLLKDEGLWRKFAEQSKITVKSYSWENSVDKLECFLRDIMERALK